MSDPKNQANFTFLVDVMERLVDEVRGLRGALREASAVQNTLNKNMTIYSEQYLNSQNSVGARVTDQPASLRDGLRFDVANLISLGDKSAARVRNLLTVQYGCETVSELMTEDLEMFQKDLETVKNQGLDD